MPEVQAKQAEEQRAQEAARKQLADQIAAGKVVELDKGLRELEDEEPKPSLVIPVPSHKVGATHSVCKCPAPAGLFHPWLAWALASTK